MAKKHLIAALGILLTAVIFPLFDVSVNADHHLDRIEKNIELRRIEITDYYDRRIETLKIRAERQLARFAEAQGAKLYENALHWYDYRYLPIGYMMADYGRMIAVEDIERARRRIDIKSQLIAKRLERAIAALQQQKAYALKSIPAVTSR